MKIKQPKFSGVLNPNMAKAPAILYQDSFQIDKFKMINDDSNPTTGYQSPKLIEETDK